MREGASSAISARHGHNAVGNVYALGGPLLDPNITTKLLHKHYMSKTTLQPAFGAKAPLGKRV